MARRTFDVIDVCEIFTHWHAGRSKNEVAGSLGLARNTVRKYVAAAEAAGMVPGGPPVSQERWAELAREWFPELADTRLRQVTWPAIEVHRDYIVAQLAAGVTMATIYQRLRDERGLAASVASLRRYVAANLPEEARRSQVTVLRLVPAEPGQEAQIDYGQLGRWTDPGSGRRHTVQAFAMVLCCSRMLFVRPVIAMDQRAWTECHVAAMEFFGGVPARLVPDNLKTGVDRPGLYDPKINRSYAELAAHYGCLVDPARSRKPRDKAQVERPMPYIRDSFWRGREFTSVAQMQADAERWCTEVAGQRACRPLDGAAPAAVFAAAEKDHLRPLPPSPFVLAEWSRCKVGPDIHVKVGKSLYSVPWKHIGQSLDARSTATMVQLFAGGDLVKTHARKPQGKQTDLADYPPEKIAFHMRTPSWCRRKAAEVGPACQALISGLLETMPSTGSAPRRACCTWRTSTSPAGSKPPAPRRPRPATRPTGPSRASLPPALKPLPSLPRPATAARQHSCTGRMRCSPLCPAPPRETWSRSGPPFPAPRRRHDPPHHAPARHLAPDRHDTGDGHAMTTTIETGALNRALRTLKLSGMLETIEGRLAQARAGELGHIDFLQVLCEDEITRRASMAIHRRLRAARFDEQVTLEGFDFTASPKLPAAQIRDLAALRWLHAGESVILYGPVGVGKSHVAQALGHLAIRHGADVRFLKTSRALAHLAGGHADQSWHKRLSELARPAILILDDFAIRELTPAQADDLYELITERAGRSLILTSNRAPQDWYPLFPNPVVAESLLDRLINNSHQLFMNGPSYRPRKRPGQRAGTTTSKTTE